MNQAKLLVAAIILLMLGGLVFKSCSKSEDEAKCNLSGKVISYVYDKCGCCPGWVVVTGSDTLKFETVPNNGHLWDLVYAYDFPIEIDFSYKSSSGSCADFYKEMTCIEMKQEISCTKAGTIIGYDYTECLCCPGWLIETDNDTIKVASLSNEAYLWDWVESVGYPIDIMFDYEDTQGACVDFYKNVTCITLKSTMYD